MTKKADALAVSITVFLIYISFMSKYYNFDGVACAIAVELGDFRHLFHGNHLLYGFAGYIFDLFLGLFGYKGFAVVSLQLMNIILSASACGILYLILREISGDRFLSIIFSFFAAFSFGYWFWASEAQVYPFSYIPMLLIFYLGVRRQAVKNIYLICFLHLAAVWGHIMHALFAAVVFYFFLIEKESCKSAARVFAKYCIVLGMGFAASYLLVICFVVRPENFAVLKEWFLASAALTEDKHFSWHGSFRLNNFLGLAKTTYTLFLPALYGRITGFINPGRLLFANAVLFLFFFVLAYRFRFLMRGSKNTVIACLVWLAVYLLFFNTWEPNTIVYSLANVFPLWILIFLGFNSLQIGTIYKRSVAVVFLAVFFLSNLFGAILSLSLEENNHRLQRALFVKNNTPDDAVVIVSVNYDKVYIPYFAGRHPFYLDWIEKNERDSTREIKKIISSGRRVYVMSGILESVKWKKYFEANYKIGKTGSCLFFVE